MTPTNDVPGIEVTPAHDDNEVRTFLNIVSNALNFGDADLDVWIEREGAENARVVRVDGHIAGGMTYQPLGQWFGGRVVSMGGVRAVGIAPEHRAAGVASTMIAAVLSEMRERGMPLATLYPSTQKVYRNAGFEKAGVRRQYRMSTHRIDVRDRTLDIRPIVPADRELLEALYTTCARRTAGHVARNPWMWQRTLDPAPWMKPIQGYVALHQGVPEGYMTLSSTLAAPPHDYVMDVQEFVATTPAAGRRLWTLLADHRSMANHVTWFGPPADPLLYLLNDQAFTMGLAIDWMMRIVDVPAALQARGYPAGLTGELHLDIHDDVLEHNNRRFVVHVDQGRAHVEAGGRGDVALDIRGLAPLYSGHLSARELISTGYLDAASVDEHDALDLATAAFAGPPPWMPDMF